MSFLSILKTIGSDALKVEHILVPIAEVLYPPAAPLLAKLDNLAQTLQASIIKAETAGPVLTSGALQSAAVVTDFEAALSTAQSLFALEGKTVTYDDATLQKAINDQVAAFNSFAMLKASIKIVTLPPAAVPVAPPLVA